MKRVLNLYVDGELVEASKIRGFNLSKEFNNFLKGRLLGPENTKELTLDNIERRRIELENTIISLNNELSSLEPKKELLIKKDNEDIERRLKELERI